MLGILSDAHGNLAGFSRGLAVLERHGAERFAFLGDALGYIPTWDVVDELYRRRDRFLFVRGNHEQLVLAPGDGGGEAIHQHQVLRDALTPARERFLASWPTSLSLKFPCGAALLVHGSPADAQFGYLYPDTALDRIEVDEDFVFCGHTHRPFVKKAGRTTFVNIGSCGLPRDDGRYGSVALFDTGSGAVRILRYDIAADTERLLQRFSTIHPAVRDLFSRRADSPFGEIDG